MMLILGSSKFANLKIKSSIILQFHFLSKQTLSFLIFLIFDHDKQIIQFLNKKTVREKKQRP